MNYEKELAKIASEAEQMCQKCGERKAANGNLCNVCLHEVIGGDRIDDLKETEAGKKHKNKPNKRTEAQLG